MAAGQSLEDAQREILAEKQPSGEIAITIQIGLFADFLCFNGATQITGAALGIDGGRVARLGQGPDPHPHLPTTPKDRMGRRRIRFF
jgi:hypothetical protein